MATTPTPFPSAEEILAYMAEVERGVGKRDICRKFKIKGEDRTRLRRLLGQLKKEGHIVPMGRGLFCLAISEEGAPELVEVEVTGVSEDGDPFCLPTHKRLVGKYPRIFLESGTGAAVGDTLWVKLTEVAGGEFLAHVVERPKEKKEAAELLGIYQADHHYFVPLSRELSKIDFVVENPPRALQDGACIRVKVGQRARGATPVTVLEVVGESSKGFESLAAIANHGIPFAFPTDVLTEAEKLIAGLNKQEISQREDLRELPIVTIDGADARDFDDAVWAEETADGGARIIVAIADVAHYVEEGSDLDREARMRGNSTYFPDRVVPMLPEKLSNDLCSLRPRENRPVLAAHLYVDKSGQLKKFRFSRAVIHSAARLTYEQVQEALDGRPDTTTRPLVEPTLKPLFKAYKLLLTARAHRGALDLDIPEVRLFADAEGNITEIGRRSRLDAHKLIEEMMILANVAAARALGEMGAPCLYRVHPEPGRQKLDNLKLFLQEQGIKARLNAGLQPAHIQKVVEKLAGREEADFLLQFVLRSQEQARYDPENIGHFGLALSHYAHFTSPIRRYSDLVVHRSLIASLRLPGRGGLRLKGRHLKNAAEHLSLTERRSQLAEWEARDRFVARYYTDMLGKDYEGRVTSVQKFGLYVSVDSGLAEGLLPLRLMRGDYYSYNPKTATLTGKRTRSVYKLGSKVDVRLIEADIITGRLTFEMVG